jgi:hypothetical protein
MENNKAESPQQSIVPLLILASKGGGAVRGIGKKFALKSVTGTGFMIVPIAMSIRPSTISFKFNTLL